MIWIILFFIFSYFVFAFAINYHKVRKLKELEIQFIMGSLQFYQLKFHMLEMLKIVYEKASETDPKYVEDYKLINISLEKKFNTLGDWWIKNLEKTLGYKLKYNSWEELIKKAEPFMKIFNEYNTRKRD